MSDLQSLIYDVPEKNTAMVQKIWEDVQGYAELLDVGLVTWEFIETDFDSGEVAYQAKYSHSIFSKTTTWRQEYDAKNSTDCRKNYHGSIRMGFAVNYNPRMETLVALCFYAYHKRIAEFCPGWVTHYYDAPKEVKS